MEDQQRIEKLQQLVGTSLHELKDTVDAACVAFDEQDATAEDIASKYLEDIYVGSNHVAQVIGLLGYFEMVSEGDDPLERIEA